jgi:hypothetical protein
MTLNLRHTSLLTGIMLLLDVSMASGQQVNSVGIFTGLTIPYTFDAGINKDPRYRTKYNVKFAPVGVHLGIDYEGYGFMIDPSIIKIGQHFNVINIDGGEVGERAINLTYFQIPLSLKLHLIDLSFFKVSLVTSVGAGFLLNGQETITHNHGFLRLRFPTNVVGTYPSPENDAFEAAHPGYTVEYDGVQVPVRTDLELLAKDDYGSFQLFGAVGFRSDWDVSETWRVSFDLRLNGGLFEPRKQAYLDQIKANTAIYDIEGGRRDLFLSFNIGIARTVEIEPRQKERAVRARQENKPRKPVKYPWPKPRNKTPKN